MKELCHHIRKEVFSAFFNIAHHQHIEVSASGIHRSGLLCFWPKVTVR